MTLSAGIAVVHVLCNNGAAPRRARWLLGHLGRVKNAQQCAEIFVQGVDRSWSGDPGAGPREYVDWVVDVAYLKRAEDEAHYREGLRRAGLPA
jgi:hypothetical protein